MTLPHENKEGPGNGGESKEAPTGLQPADEQVAGATEDAAPAAEDGDGGGSEGGEKE